MLLKGNEHHLYTTVVSCIMWGNDMKAQSILRDHDPVQLCGNLQSTLLHHSATHGNAAMTKYLIERGCRVDAEDNNGSTPLMIAVEKTHLEAVKILLDAGADIYAGRGKTDGLLKGISKICKRFHFTDSEDHYGRPTSTWHDILAQVVRRVGEDFVNDKLGMAKLLFESDCPLQHVIRILKNTEMTRYYLEHGYPVNTRKPKDGLTPLSMAIRLNDPASVKVLLEYGASFDSNDYNLRNEIFGCFKSGASLEIFELYLLHADDLQSELLKIEGIPDRPDSRVNSQKKLLIAHLVLLVARGHELHHRTGFDIRTRPALTKIFNRYQQQLEKMKFSVVYESITMFDLAIIDDKKLTRYAANEDLISNFEVVILSQGSSHSELYYYKYVQERVAKAVNMVKHQPKASLVISEITGIHQDLVLDKIVNYLSISDFYSLFLV